MRRRGVELGLAALAALLILAGCFGQHWWSGQVAGMQFRIGLGSMTGCALDDCRSFSFAALQPGSRGIALFPLLATLTRWVGVVCALVIAGSALLRLTRDQRSLSRPAAALGGALVLLAVATWISFPGDQVGGFSLGWGLPVVVLGVGAALAGELSGSQAFGGVGDVHVVNLAAATATPRPKPLEDPRAELPGRHRPSLGKVGNASVDTSAASLRFVARSLTVSPTGVTVILADGGTREAAWGALTSVFIGQLPPDPPYEKAVFLDLVSAGTPFRIMQSTKANYAALPGGAATTAVDNFRRLADLVQARNPAVEIDPLTLGFVRERKAPRLFAGLAQFRSYDARYGG